jgi:1-aminocyclopropane-1-carboxylate deaminase/D-cysteine desulfhydrase-like pyridoxal-dependent ACC family enzyme
MTFSERSKIPLDPIYTGKMFGYENDREQLFSATYSKILLIHTGGSSRNLDE